jgi:hypothetical protein
MEIIGKIALYSAGFGALAGIISAVLSIAGISGWVGLLIAILCIYVLVSRLIPSALSAAKPAPPAPGQTPTMPQAQEIPDKRKIFTTGFFPFFVMWLVLWIMVYTLII